MSFLITAPGVLAEAAGKLRNVGDEMAERSAAAGKLTAGVIRPADDEVSVWAVEQLRAAAADYQAVMGMGSVHFDRLLTALSDGEEEYSQAEASNAESFG